MASRASVMQRISTFFNRYQRWKYIRIIVAFIFLISSWMLEFISPSVTLSLFIIGTTVFYSLRKSRKTLGKHDAIVITGCDTGLGYSLALHCHDHLNVQVIAGVHNLQSDGAKSLTKHNIHVLPLDITDTNSIKSFVQSIDKRIQTKGLTLRSLVNNAGTMTFGEFEWQTDEQITQQVSVNLLGTMKLTKAFLPLLRKHLSRLIVVTSHCACESLPGVAIYGATKAGLDAWTTSLRVELKKYGVEVVNFIPGSFIGTSNLLSQQCERFAIMESAMTQEAREFYDDYFQRYAAYFVPLSRNVKPQRMENSQLYDIFDDALLEVKPTARYKCEPWRYTFYHSLFKITTTSMRDLLVEKFVQMPAWKEQKKKSE